MFKKRLFTSIISLYLISLASNAQQLTEVEAPDFIRSIEFRGSSDDQFPMISMGDTAYLSFDDLNASESNYYYKIIHCDYNWIPSKLLKSEYLNGYDNIRIDSYQNSYNTLFPYSNYQLSIPNNDIQLKVSGNYLLEIYDDSDELMFSRKFLVYEPKTKVGVSIKRNRDFNTINSKQNLEFNIFTEALESSNPKREIKTVIMQNYRWDTAIYDLFPQYNLGSELQFKYDDKASFFAGNEYLNFDTKDIRVAQGTIATISLEDQYNHYLYTNTPRNNVPYTFFPDIDGDFRIRTLQGENSSIEADYTWVHFSLSANLDPLIETVYLVGKFNNHQLLDEFKMEYDKKSNAFQAIVLFKQGFYNYKYVGVDKKGNRLENSISGNFHVTENRYHVLVYYRKFGSIYDRLIGIGNTNSSVIEN